MTFKSLLTGVAALLLATGTVHAGDALISGQEQGSCGPYKEPPSRGQLPEAILGDWCSKEGSFDTQVIYTRGIDCEDPVGNITIQKDGYKEPWSDCKFDKIAQSTPSVYLVHVRCEALSEGDGTPNGHIYSENLEIRMDGQNMIWRWLSEL